MNEEESIQHQRRMLKFSLEKKYASIDSLISRIEGYLDGGTYERNRGPQAARAAINKSGRLLIEALDVIKKLSGKGGYRHAIKIHKASPVPGVQIRA
jgi:hypothetical protein